MKKEYVDDQYTHLESDVEKMRGRFRQYISYSNERGAMSLADEGIENAKDECKNPRSPGDHIWIQHSEIDGFLDVEDNGRGIPTALMEKLFTSLNMGSNIKTGDKSQLKADILGQNGTGTLAICALSEDFYVTSYRGGTENRFKTIHFHEGYKVDENEGKCPRDRHGVHLHYKPSKVMGKNTRFVWDDIKSKMDNFQFLNRDGISISVKHIKEDGEEETFEYESRPLVDILGRNGEDSMMSSTYSISAAVDGVEEELDGETVPRFVAVDFVFGYVKGDPYVDSFSNSINTVDGGDHIDGVLESMCRFFQNQAKNSMSDREKEKLDIKWDDVKASLSIVVSLRTNWERLYTGQTKHKVVSAEVRKLIQQMVTEELQRYFGKNPKELKEIIAVVKTNARARREGEKVRSAVVKSSMSKFEAYRMKNFDPCTAKRGERKELYIVEGDSAKGLLKLARDPKFQALFAVRGVGANVMTMSPDQVFGPKGNREYTQLMTVLGCGYGDNFDMKKLAYDIVVIASDADVDGFHIRTILLMFFFRFLPQLILEGRLYIAEPPLYRVDDKKNPFVVNKREYTRRYYEAASKFYRIGYTTDDKGGFELIDRNQMADFLAETRYYVEDMTHIAERYKVNARLLEIILEHACDLDPIPMVPCEHLDMYKLMDAINVEFPELYFDKEMRLITGSINGNPQSIEITNQMLRRSKADGLSSLIKRYRLKDGQKFVLISIKTKERQVLSMLELLKVMQKYQPNILHRFKGLGENDPEDIKTTIMDPATRSLIKVTMSDPETALKTLQMLGGDSEIDRVGRREAYLGFSIDRDTIDT